MEKILRLSGFYWTRERAIPLKAEALGLLEQLTKGDVLVLQASEVEAFDYSFAAELFGNLIKNVKVRDGQFLVVDNLNEYNQVNLQKALESLELCIIARHSGTLELLGKVNPVDAETFEIVALHSSPIATADVQERLGVSINATNERLKKLLGLGLIRRTSGRSAAGREQFLYRTLS